MHFILGLLASWPREASRLEAVLPEAEAKTHEAEAKAEARTHEAEAEAKTHEAEAEARFFGLEAEARPRGLTSLTVYILYRQRTQICFHFYGATRDSKVYPGLIILVLDFKPVFRW